MEKILEVYKRPYDEKRPVVCMDESPKQLIGETKTPIAARPGSDEKYDYEYVRNGVCNIFMSNEPLAGKRLVKVTERKTGQDWAVFVEEIASRYKDADRITLVMDNLETHKPGSLYESFPPEKAKALWDRFEFIYTPKHGSWLNMAEIELNVLMKQCLAGRIPDFEKVKKQTRAWQEKRNNKNAKINWRFTTDDARIKLRKLYPLCEDWHDTSRIEPYKLHELLEFSAIALKNYHNIQAYAQVKNVKIYNCCTNSFVDAFERKTYI